MRGPDKYRSDIIASLTPPYSLLTKALKMLVREYLIAKDYRRKYCSELAIRDRDQQLRTKTGKCVFFSVLAVVALL